MGSRIILPAGRHGRREACTCAPPGWAIFGAEACETVPQVRRLVRPLGGWRTLVDDEPPDAVCTERRPQRDPSAERVADDVDLAAGHRGESFDDHRDVVELSLDAVTGAVAARPAAAAIDGVDTEAHAEQRPHRSECRVV